MGYLHSLKSTEALWIQELAREIWEEYYPRIISMQQIDYMLQRFYHIDSLRDDFEQNVQFYSILDQEKRGGFISIESLEDESYFIHKFYIHHNYRKLGMGTNVFQELIRDLFPNSKEIRLKVNRYNIESINFYFKNGFIIETYGDFEIGNGFYMNDYIMCWKRIKNQT